jgi:hypothetical protein
MQLEKPVLPLAGAAKKYVRISAALMPPGKVLVDLRTQVRRLRLPRLERRECRSPRSVVVLITHDYVAD